jgi:hypothetical protein
MEKLLHDYHGPPIMANGDRLPRVPWNIYAAAAALLQGDRQGDIKLGRAFASELKELTTTYKHEFCQVDPMVVISDSIALSSGFVVYTEEATPISWLLLAIFLQLSPRMQPLGKSYSDLVVRPYEGHVVEGCQRFALRAQVLDELKARGLDADQVVSNLRIHMMRAGEMSPSEACDGLWLEECLKEMANVVKGH